MYTLVGQMMKKVFEMNVVTFIQIATALQNSEYLLGAIQIN